MPLQNPNLESKTFLVGGHLLKVFGANHVMVKAVERANSRSFSRIKVLTEYGSAIEYAPKPDTHYKVSAVRTLAGNDEVKFEKMNQEEIRKAEAEYIRVPRNLFEGYWFEYYCDKNDFGDTFRTHQVKLKPRYPPADE